MEALDQHNLLVRISERLMRKYRIDPSWDDEMNPENLKDIDGRLRSIRPDNWPNHTLVDLDNTRDLGAWLRHAFPESLSYHILGSEKEDFDTAECLAESYLEELEENRTERYEGENEADLVKQDFISFIREWRRIVVEAIVSDAQHLQDGQA
jgi:hypothetical protein